ncbi:hypothetical protein [Xylella fastidiosa]|uniref:hypothetical protein n=1 Tax=Xylella fastidiosa TaxID=2371 RepID=UPI0018AD47FC|nr:hypothetical protein [Xylella fastidiosa]UIX82648.1 hypothetical protein LZ756_13270 [Xylella fastidiosa subsp. sandyi]
MKLIKDGKLEQAQINQWLDDALTAVRDRALFGLSEKSALSPSASPSDDADKAGSSFWR